MQQEKQTCPVFGRAVLKFSSSVGFLQRRGGLQQAAGGEGPANACPEAVCSFSHMCLVTQAAQWAPPPGSGHSGRSGRWHVQHQFDSGGVSRFGQDMTSSTPSKLLTLCVCLCQKRWCAARVHGLFYEERSPASAGQCAGPRTLQQGCLGPLLPG